MTQQNSVYAFKKLVQVEWIIQIFAGNLKRVGGGYFKYEQCEQLLVHTFLKQYPFYKLDICL